MKVYRWKDARGQEHLIPWKSCVICKYCTGIFMDPLFGNRVFACTCELKDIPTPSECPDFIPVHPKIIYHLEEVDAT